MLNLLDREAPHLRFSSENNCFYLKIRSYCYCMFSASEIMVAIPLWSLESGGGI